MTPPYALLYGSLGKTVVAYYRVRDNQIRHELFNTLDAPLHETARRMRELGWRSLGAAGPDNLAMTIMPPLTTLKGVLDEIVAWAQAPQAGDKDYLEEVARRGLEMLDLPMVVEVQESSAVVCYPPLKDKPVLFLDYDDAFGEGYQFIPSRHTEDEDDEDYYAVPSIGCVDGHDPRTAGWAQRFLNAALQRRRLDP